MIISIKKFDELKLLIINSYSSSDIFIARGFFEISVTFFSTEYTLLLLLFVENLHSYFFFFVAKNFVPTYVFDKRIRRSLYLSLRRIHVVLHFAEDSRIQAPLFAKDRGAPTAGRT